VDEEAIFAAALECATPEARRALVKQACAGDANLEAQIKGLLQAHDHPDAVLQPLGASFPPTIEALVPERPGTVIGPYKLLEQIGEGGMGLVFMAEQTRPVRRRVALKVLQPGMDTRQVVARFEAERQALALMDHPHIARVFDAGVTEAGRPYFVMDLVRGVPITQYCDERRLSTRQRLELFVAVCQAAQHAHQKGVIHRDLKPTNVLVTQHDTVAVPKIIDFGIAKATAQPLTERTLFTNFAQMVGTPLYMSPEQAEMSGLDVDTRSDVYSLGVLLYELLTGRNGRFDRERPGDAGDAADLFGAIDQHFLFRRLVVGDRLERDVWHDAADLFAPLVLLALVDEPASARGLLLRAPQEAPRRRRHPDGRSPWPVPGRRFSPGGPRRGTA
jgi:serine/threonine-protein kinase